MTARTIIITNGISGITQRVAATDTVQVLGTAATLTLAANTSKSRIGVLITVETNPIRLAFGADAVQTGGSEVGHVIAAGESFYISNGYEAINASFINMNAQANGILQVTPYFETPNA